MTLIKGRPEVEFDATNRTHREAYRQYLRDRGWGKLPFRFVTSGTYGITLGHIERALLDYYTSKEFDGKKRV